MYGEKELRDHLRAKLGVGDRQLRRLIAAKAGELPSTNQQALWALAHENRMRLANYLTAEQIAEVRNLVPSRPAPATAKQSNGRAAPVRRKPSARTVAMTIGLEKHGEIPALKPLHATEAKAMAERVYPLLYVFENSLRDLIEVVLKAKYGDDWWTKAVPSKVREAADDLKQKETKDTYHGKRGRRDIDYLLLTQLWKIVNNKWKDFEPLFPPGKHWVQSVIENDMNVSRRPIAHMNPLEDDDIKNVETTFRKWVRNLQAVADKLPQA
jgi:Swt1-like HEPN